MHTQYIIGVYKEVHKGVYKEAHKGVVLMDLHYFSFRYLLVLLLLLNKYSPGITACVVPRANVFKNLKKY